MNIHQRRRQARLAILDAQRAAKKAAEEAPKVEEPKAAPKVEVVTKAELKKLTKDELEQLGRDKFNVELDKRKMKSSLIKEILKAQDNG